MTVGELKKKLTHYNDDDLVIMATDPEGNDFTKSVEFEECVYIPEHNIVRLKELTNALREQGFTEEDVADGYREDGFECIDAICFWP